MRRERLARFMVELSGNHSVVHELIIESVELHNAIIRHRAGRGTAVQIREQLVHRGMSAAITGHNYLIRAGHPRLDALSSNVLREPEFSVMALVDLLDRPTISSFRQGDQETASAMQQSRVLDAGRTPADRRYLELSNALGSGQLARRFTDLLVKLGGSPADFRTWTGTPAHLLSFTGDVPGLDVMATLMLYRDRNASHAVHQNDGKDLSFLRVAIPYANIVVTEKQWASIARASGAAKRYGTDVLGDLAALPELLASNGCF